MKRAISLLMIFASLLAVTSCGGEVPPIETTADTTPTEVTEAVDKYGRKIIPHGLPSDLDFGGVTINCLVREDPQYSIDFGVESQNGDVVNDAVFERNSRIEDEIGVKFNIIGAPVTNTASSEAVGDLLRQAVMAGDASYDLCAFYQIYGATLGMDGLLLNVNDLKYVDFTKPWWNQTFADELTYKGQLYYTVGSMNLSVTSSLMGVFFNQTKVVDYHKDYDFLYQLVYDGKWTLDEFSSLVKDVYTDMNGNSTADDGDFFGLTMVEDDPGPWNSALGIRLCTKDSSGIPQLSFYNERAVTAYEKLYSLYRKTEGVYFGAKGYDYKTAFANGRSMFAVCALGAAETHLRDMKDGYGLLPMPKLDEAQESYYNSARDSSNLTGIATNCQNPDAVAAALELMNYYSYLDVTPAYFEVAMKTKYLADSDSANMFDTIVNNVRVDFGEIYSLTISGGTYSMKGIFAGQFRNLIRLQIEDLGSNYAENENIYKAGLAGILAKYDELAK